MDHRNHRIASAGIVVARVEQPPLDVQAVTFPVDVFEFSPGAPKVLIRASDLLPRTDRASPDFWRMLPRTVDGSDGPPIRCNRDARCAPKFAGYRAFRSPERRHTAVSYIRS